MERKIIDYVSLFSPNCIDDLVKEKIIKGWQPCGGFSIYGDADGDLVYYQAMVKYE